MSTNSFFCHLSSQRMAEMIAKSKGPICYAGPGIHMPVAVALADAARRIDQELITVWIDFDERAMRMGYGEIEAVKHIREAGIEIHHAAALRSSLFIADGEGYTFTPTPLYLEPEPVDTVRNALRLTESQVSEALVRLSSAARVIAVSLASSHEEKSRISNLPEEGNSVPVDKNIFEAVQENLSAVPPVKFDVARQVRVFEPYLQYVDLRLTGAAIQRHRVAIPPSIQKLGSSKELEGRLRTTFDLIRKDGDLSSKPLETELNEIRKNFTPSLGKEHGRVVLKGAKKELIKRLDTFQEKLQEHQKKVHDNLQEQLNDSKQQIIEYYLPIVLSSPPDALLGRLLSGDVTEDLAIKWLTLELDKVFPKAEYLVKKMTLDVQYKDVTFETLNREDFLTSVKKAFPEVDWEGAYEEFKAAGEKRPKQLVMKL